MQPRTYVTFCNLAAYARMSGIPVNVYSGRNGLELIWSESNDGAATGSPIALLRTHTHFDLLALKEPGTSTSTAVALKGPGSSQSVPPRSKAKAKAKTKATAKAKTKPKARPAGISKTSEKRSQAKSHKCSGLRKFNVLIWQPTVVQFEPPPAAVDVYYTILYYTIICYSIL